VRSALALDAQLPVIHCDARGRETTKATLITLVRHAMELRKS
jgi:hypothetical protein